MNEKPKVAVSGIAMFVATLVVWGWNVQMAETEWVLIEPISLAAVGFVTWFIGPLLRGWEKLTKKWADD